MCGGEEFMMGSAVRGNPNAQIIVSIQHDSGLVSRLCRTIGVLSDNLAAPQFSAHTWEEVSSANRSLTWNSSWEMVGVASGEKELKRES